MPTSSWSPTELSQLQLAYTQGVPLKTLAQQLGRSPSALNKALTRFRIRPPRPPKQEPSSPRPSPFFRHSHVKLRTSRLHLPRLISMEQLMLFLNQQGYCAQTRRFLLNQHIYPYYLINQRPSSPVHLLVLANTLRLQQRLPIFSLPHHELKYPGNSSI